MEQEKEGFVRTQALYAHLFGVFVLLHYTHFI